MLSKFYIQPTFKFILLTFLGAAILSMAWMPIRNASAQDLMDEAITELPTIGVPTLLESTPQPESTIPAFTPTPEITATVESISTPTEIPALPFTPTQNDTETVQISSHSLNLAFLLPQTWQVLNSEEISEVGNEDVIKMTYPEKTDEIVIVTLPKEIDITIDEWFILQAPHFPSDIQSTKLSGNIFRAPTILAFGHIASEGNTLYTFIDRGKEIVEISYFSRTSFVHLSDYEKVLSSLNIFDYTVSQENIIPDMTAIFDLETSKHYDPRDTQEQNTQRNETTGIFVTSPVIKKLSNLSYVDQVYAQYTKEGKPNFAEGEKWNWCGPSSLTMALKYFGVLGNTDINQATLNTSQKIMIGGQTLWPAVSSNTKVADYTSSFGIKTLTADKLSSPHFISFSEIKSEINAGKPILMGVIIKGSGHWILITGYEENGSSQYVYVNDPYGNANWNVINHKWTGTIWEKPLNTWTPIGKETRYTYQALSSIKRCTSCWAVFQNNPSPKITTLSQANAPAGSSDQTITITGANFVIGAIARFNGNDLVTTYINSTQLKATIPASLIKSVMTANISVFNHLPGGGISNSIIFTINNPKPSITSISHRLIAQTGPDLTITVTGTGFTPTSVVKLNSTSLTTTYINATQLKAVIKSSLRTGVGSVLISVYTSAPGGGTSNSQLLVKADFYNQVSIISYHSKKAIDLPGGRSDNLIKIQQWAWDRLNNNQKWLLIPTGNLEEYWIASPSTTKCLDIANSSKDNWANLIQNACNFGNSQRFKRINQGYGWLGTVSGKNYGSQNYYSFVSVNSSKYLDVDNWSTQNGALILQYIPGNKQGNQMWYILKP